MKLKKRRGLVYFGVILAVFIVPMLFGTADLAMKEAAVDIGAADYPRAVMTADSVCSLMFVTMETAYTYASVDDFDVDRLQLAVETVLSSGVIDTVEAQLDVKDLSISKPQVAMAMITPTQYCVTISYDIKFREESVNFSERDFVSMNFDIDQATDSFSSISLVDYGYYRD